MKKIGILLAVIIAVVVMVIPVSAKKKGEAHIKFPQSTYNFGTIPERQGTVSCTFEFENTGTAPLVIVDATAECGCTVPEFPEAPVAPGKKGVIKVTYNPLGRPYGFKKRITVKTNGKPKKVFLYITGSVNPNK